MGWVQQENGGGGAVYGLRPVGGEQVRLGVANKPGKTAL